MTLKCTSGAMEQHIVTKKENLEGNLNSDKTKEVFQMFQDMEKDGYAIATEKNGTDEFRSGQVAMYVCAHWP